jgi:hypothetical protein
MVASESPRSSPADIALALVRFADALLPGDALFPSASAAGAHGVMAARLRERLEPDSPARLAEALIVRDGLADPAGAATRLQGEEPKQFETARTFLTFAYYEAPAVIAAIRALGHEYNEAPQPAGYEMRPFDPARDAPAVPRGHYVATEAVSRVDLSTLAFLRDGTR